MTFTRADLMKFPEDSVPELPQWTYTCGCDSDVLPFEQARSDGMLLCHYECGSCGRVWGLYLPLCVIEVAG